MKFARLWWMAALLLVLSALPIARLALPTAASAQEPAKPASGVAPASPVTQESQNSTPVIKTETRLVLVDTVVTDKKGSYLDNLTQKDFKVWEDDKEQPIKTFSVEAGAAAPNVNRRHYLVLFFDNSTMNLTDQGRARDAAGKFIEANAGPDRYIALVEYTGIVHVAVNFTDDAEVLRKAVKTMQFSIAGTPQFSHDDPSLSVTSMGDPTLSSVEGDYAAHTLLLAIRSVAKNMAGVPGRKSLVLITAGFPMTPERQEEMPAVLDTCNKANVAIYPIDVRGLITPVSGGMAQLDTPEGWDDAPGFTPAVLREDANGRLITAVLDGDDDAARLVYVQRGGGGGSGGTGRGGGGGGVGGGGGTGGGSRGTGGTGTGGTGSGGHGGTGSGSGSRGSGGGGTRTSTSAPGYYPGYNPNIQPHLLVPDSSALASTNQELMFQLANGTGGFMIANSNDLLAGMQKIAKEQTQYYVLGYTPPQTEEGSCHQLKVKVGQSGAVVRSRSGYCNVRSTDLLAGKAEGKALEDRVKGSQVGNVEASMRAPYFFVTNNTARVNLAMDLPGSAIKFEKVKGKYHSTLNILGIAYKQDGTVSARFSDAVNIDLEDKKEVEELNNKPFHYENQFDVASGSYDLKVAFSSGGDSFGKLQMPLVVDSYDAAKFSLSAVALSRDFHKSSQMATTMDAALLEDRIPLVSKDVQFIPSGGGDFKKTDNAGFYVEVYDPLLNTGKPPKVGLSVTITETKSGKQAMQAGGDITADARPGTPVIPVGLRLPLNTLEPGTYRLDVKAMDTAGNNSPLRSVYFEVK